MWIKLLKNTDFGGVVGEEMEVSDADARKLVADGAARFFNPDAPEIVQSAKAVTTTATEKK